MKHKKVERYQVKKGQKVNAVIKYSVMFIMAVCVFHSPLPTPHSLISFAGEFDTHSGPTQADEIPSKPMPPATPEFIAAGKEIYNFRCAPCH